MTDEPSNDEEKAAEAEFQRVLDNLAKMPPKPHKPNGSPAAAKAKAAPPAKKSRV